MDYTIDDATNLSGISHFVDQEDIKANVIPGKVEADLLAKPVEKKDYDKEYKDLLNGYYKKYNLGKQKMPIIDSDDDDILSGNFGAVGKQDKHKKVKRKDTKRESSDDISDDTCSDDDISGILSSLTVSDDEDFKPSRKTKTPKMPLYDSDSDSDINYFTNEQRKQGYVDDIIGKQKNEDDSLLYDIDEQNRKSKRTNLIIDINFLRKGLGGSKNPDLKDYPKPKDDMPIAYLEALKSQLLALNQRSTSSELVEEGIMLATKGLGKIFNGKREILGVRPQLKNFHGTAQIKLRRLRYETSQILPSIMGTTMQNPILKVGASLGIGMLLHSGLASKVDKEDSEDDGYDSDDYKNDLQRVGAME